MKRKNGIHRLAAKPVAAAVALGVLGTLVALIAGLGAAAGDDGAAAEAVGMIVYRTIGEGDLDWNIYVINTDGTGGRRLNDTYSQDADPAWSPDGSQIAYAATTCCSARAGVITVMDSDGSGGVALTDDGNLSYHPTWSPDGSMIAYSSRERGSGPSEIFTMRSDGSGKVQITENDSTDVEPAWSPDGSRIAFVAVTGEGRSEIRLIRSDGTDEIQLAVGADQAISPAWSPDGTRIAYVSGGYRGQIHIINADGTNDRGLLESPSCQDHPTWSPDGTKIAFTRCDAPVGIHVVALDGGDAEKIGPGGWAPDWNPVEIKVLPNPTTTVATNAHPAKTAEPFPDLLPKTGIGAGASGESNWELSWNLTMVLAGTGSVAFVSAAYFFMRVRRAVRRQR